MTTSISLFDAMGNVTRGTNGMVAFKSTGSALLDLFSKIGDARSLDIAPYVKAALKENEEVALRILLWARDVRGGAGERDTFRKTVAELARGKDFEGWEGFLRLIPEIGRWDDLFVTFGTKWETEALHIIEAGLAAQDGLCAKWMPRKGLNAKKIREHIGITPKQYRKLVVGLTQVVETAMCAKKWDGINYEHVPSKAMQVYAKAFARNDSDRFTSYKSALTRGEVKVNASAVFPYDVVHLLKRDPQLAEAQWKALPDYLEGSDERLLAVVDVSGSMESPAGGYTTSGKQSSVTCMDVAISLGIYVSQRLEGVFKDSFITFTDHPTLVRETGSLQQRVYAARRHVGYNTDLIGVFDAVLNAAVANKVPEDQMPTKIVIMSDTQFDAQIGNFNSTSIKIIERKYEAAGYKMPGIVYWNIGAAKYGNSPVTQHTTGAAMVSGFSPAIMTSILGSKVDSMSIMLDAIGKERYNYLAA